MTQACINKVSRWKAGSHPEKENFWIELKITSYLSLCDMTMKKMTSRVDKMPISPATRIEVCVDMSSTLLENCLNLPHCGRQPFPVLINMSGQVRFLFFVTETFPII